ncbi:MAG: hypothetical protein Q9172_001100 [Xanthocarpia lactea]
MALIIVAVIVVLLIIVIWSSWALIKHYISGDPAGATQRVVVELPSMKDTTARHFSDPGICLNILKGTTYSSDESLGTNKLSLLVSRAIPNQRLVRAFGIDNGFTTFDPEKRADFLSEARERLAKVAGYGWEGIASTAEDVAEKYVEKISPGKGEGHLECMVQIISLKVIFENFFGFNALRLRDGSMLDVARGINKQWIASKLGDHSDKLGISQIQSVFQRLEIHTEDPQNTPLNILLPVYETLWRVVLHCLIEVLFRPSSDLDWREILKAFLRKPDKQQFEQRGAGVDSVSVQFLVYEALRLYPPTRRIYRQMHMSTITEPELIAADIEACHRLPEIWGDDSHQYHPGRWNSVNRHMRKAFMPFGGPPYQCPASASFGPMMIGVLVAAIASELSPTVWRLSYGEERSVSRVLDDEMELDPGRFEKTSWFLLRESRDMGSHQSYSDE